MAYAGAQLGSQAANLILAAKGVIEKQFNEESWVWNKLRKERGFPVEKAGKHYQTKFAHILRKPGNIGAFMAETASIPAATEVTVQQSTITLKLYVRPIAVTGMAEKLVSKRDPYTFAEVWRTEMEGAVSAAIRDISIQLWGNGDGILAKTAADPGTGDNFTASTTAPMNGAHYLHVGDKIQFYNPSTGAARSGGPYTITSISGTTVRVTPNIDNSVASGDAVGIYGQGVTGSGATSYTITGLQRIINDATGAATIQGLSRSTYPEAEAIVDSSTSTREPTPQLITWMMQRIEQASGDTVDTIVAHPAVRQRYADLLFGQRQYTSASFDEGIEQLTVAAFGQRVKFEADRYAPWNSIYFINWGKLKAFVAKDLGEEAEQWMESYYAKQRLLTMIMELGATKFRSHGVLKNINQADASVYMPL